jgi:O-antigen/teichoic acid export membrane protein
VSNVYETGRIGSALRTYLSLKLVGLALSLFCQVLVVKTLVPTEYATFALFLAFVTAGERVLSFGLDRTTMRYVPQLAGRGDKVALAILLRRLFAVRLSALLFFFVVFGVAAFFFHDAFPTPLGAAAGIGFVIWFVAYTVMSDADPLAQSLLAHASSAGASLFEVVLRTALVAVLLPWPGGASATVIVCVFATTQSLAAIWLVARLFRAWRRLDGAALADAPPIDASFDPRHAVRFALANYASTVLYLVSSPPVVRIVAATGLGAVPLAAFSFMQTLALSLQRLLPGMLVLPSLEPFVMSRVLEHRRERVQAVLSLVFKFEVIVLLGGIVFVAIAGREVLLLLARVEYAPYYQLLPLLLVYVSLATAYRMLEMVANAAFRHHLFYWFLPLGFVSIGLIALTVGPWGLLAVVFWPTLEIFVRVVALTMVLRRHAAAALFDVARLAPVVVLAVVLIGIALALQQALGLTSALPVVALAIGADVALLAGVLMLRPFRPSEAGGLEAALPRALHFLLPLARATSRP